MKTRKNEALALYKKLKKVNVGVVVATLIKEGHACGQEDALHQIDACLQWMALAQFVEPNKMLVMFDRKIDNAFHAFVLNTRFYAGFCEKAFGSFLHHDPLDVQTTPIDEVKCGIEYTITSFKYVYGSGMNPLIAEHVSRGISVKAITCLSRQCVDNESPAAHAGIS